MKTMKSIVSLLLACVLCLGSIAFAEAPVVYELGGKIEDFTVTTWDGQTVTLSEVLKEKEAVLINIWATWCGPCRNEFPFMEEAYKQYADKVEVIALSSEPTDTDDVLASFVAEMGMTFKVAQDTVGMAEKFNVSAIPTSVVIDRFGTICFWESGSLPDVGSFTRLFDAFLGEDYTESVILDGVPPMKPNVAASAEADVAAALGVAAAANPTGEYTWPMVVTEKDGRSVVASTNKGVSSSEANVSTHVAAKAGDAIVVTFKISSEAGCDVMQLRVNDQVVKSFGGEKDWMTYAYPVEADGDCVVTIAYVNDMMSSAGDDTLWVDSIALMSGDEAAAALAANPVYPVAEQIAITVLNENAKKIVINDPTGLVAAYYGGAEFYLIPDEEAIFQLDMVKGYDPETALVSFNFDGSTYALSDCIVDGKYVASAGGDSLETTGYCDSSVYLYPDLANYQLGKTITYFKSEENVNYFVSDLTKDQATGAVLGSWTYEDGTMPTTTALPGEAAQVSGMADYVVKYVDQDGNPVAGVMCQVCDEETCQVFVSDENGVCAFTLAPYAWEIHTLMVPAGYEGDTTTVTIAPVEGGELVFTLTRL